MMAAAAGESGPQFWEFISAEGAKSSAEMGAGESFGLDRHDRLVIQRAGGWSQAR
jgi:hypothetical protein